MRKALMLICAGIGCLTNLLAETDDAGVRKFPTLLKPGVHPRVYITEGEKADLKQRMYETEFGKKQIVGKILPTARKFMFEGAGKKVYDVDPQNLDKETVEKILNGHIEGVAQHMGVLALEAWVNDDAELKKKVIRLAVNQASVMLKSKELLPDHSFWRKPDVVGRDWGLGEEFRMGGAGLAATYDLLYNDMTEEQRAVIRKCISVCISGRRSHALGWPKTKLFSNWFPLHGEMGNMMLVIEGEEGYDPELYKLWKKGLQEWLEVGISPNGANHEDGYIYYALRGGMGIFYTTARRGEKLAHHPSFRNLLKWQAMWEPAYGPVSGYQTFHVVLDRLYPKDPIANMFWARRVGENYENPLSWQSLFYTVLCGDDYKGKYADAVDYNKLGLPQSMFDKRRGVQIVRNGYGPDDLLFRMHARADSMLVGHAAVDSGSFELQSDGREWVHHTVGDKSGSFHSYDYSIVHIDGKAQGMKPPIVNVIKEEDKKDATLMVADLTYAYNWQWFYGWPLPGVKGRELPGNPWVPETADPYELGWPKDQTWLPHDISNQPDLGFEGVWQMKKRINDVKNAFRTAIVARGKHPYVLMVDDVKKDDNEHLYEWYLSVPGDVECPGSYQNNVILQDEAAGDKLTVKKDTRRLLVKVLSPYEDMPKTNPYFYDTPTFISGMRFGKHQSLVRQDERNKRYTLEAKMFKRLDIPYTGKDGNFVVMLFPYKTNIEGDKAYNETPLGSTDLPETSWNKDKTELTVKIGDQTDVFTFKKLDSGRREVSMTRNGKKVF